MRRLVVLERITLDGVFDAASMGQWDFPYHSDGRAEVIFQGSDASLLVGDEAGAGGTELPHHSEGECRLKRAGAGR